ncbi:MAG: YbhB/YbcL family Raf kinase inhibitor-like protein [Bacteroidetes bacterium]|nr:YbhB/YbcL family Raf kinase inhibitor-like protein [Bacteroidota bacterium]
MELVIKSSEFKNNDLIPVKYSCDGINISPQLSWTCKNEEVKSFVLFFEDLDDKNGTPVHWILFNIPSFIHQLHEDITTVRNIPDDIRFGTNDFGKIGYKGPCPQSGTHHYAFKIFALNKGLPLESGSSKKEILKAMEGHVIAKGKLIGKYKKSNNKLG